MNREERRVIERYAYCWCLHVRPGTIFIGVINLAGSLLCAILFLGDLIFHQSNLPLGTPDDPLPAGRINPNYGKSTATSLAIIMYMMCATVAGMLLFGVVKSRPSYLMPFFWIQLCDFFFSLPSFLSSLYANPAHHGHYGSSWSSTSGGGMSGGDDVTRGSGGPFMRKFGFNHGTQAGHTSSLLIATCIILFKGYFLCVVWKCYRYLKMKEMMTLPIHLSGGGSAGLHAYHASALGLHVDMRNGGPDIVIPPGFNIPNPNILSSMAPPDYETATKSNGAQQSPPDYEAALKTQQNIRTKDDNEQNGQDQTSSSTDSSNVCLGPDNSDQSPAVVQLEPSSQVNSSNDILATGISSSPSDASASVAAGHPAPVDHQQQK